MPALGRSRGMRHSTLPARRVLAIVDRPRKRANARKMARKHGRRSRNDERRRMAGAHDPRHRHDACVLDRRRAAPHTDRTRRARRHAGPRPFGEIRRLHGRRFRARHRPPRPVLRAVGRRRQSRRRTAGSVSRPQPRHRADRAQDRLASAPQRLSGTAARAAVRRGDEVRRRSRLPPPTCRVCCARRGARS